MKNFCEALTEIRKNKKYSMNGLAIKMDKKSGWINNIEKGNRVPKVENLEKIMEALELNDTEKKELKKLWELAKGKSKIVKEELENKEKEIKDLKRVVEVLKDDVNHNKIPYFESVAASAGYGCLNDDACSDYIEVPSNFAKSGNIAINVKGDSMYPKIENGDIIIVDTKEKENLNFKIAVVNYSDELFVKKIEISSNKILLHSINTMYPPIEVEDISKIIPIGKVVFSYREYN